MAAKEDIKLGFFIAAGFAVFGIIVMVARGVISRAA